MGVTGVTTEQAIGTAQAARMLGVSEGRVRQLAAAGALPFTRTTHGRLFDPADLDALLLARERAQQAPRRRRSS